MIVLYIVQIIYLLLYFIFRNKTNCECKFWFLYSEDEICIGIYRNKIKNTYYLFLLPFIGIKYNPANKKYII